MNLSPYCKESFYLQKVMSSWLTNIADMSGITFNYWAQTTQVDTWTKKVIASGTITPISYAVKSLCWGSEPYREGTQYSSLPLA